MKPAGSVFSEMFKLLNVFLSIESRAETSVLSMYSISGLLKESQVDNVSSKETDISSNLLIVSLMLETTETRTGPASSLCGKEGGWAKTGLESTFDKVGILFPATDDLLVHVGVFFFVLGPLIAQCTYQYEQ